MGSGSVYSSPRWIGAGKMTKPCLEEETRLCHLREVGIQRRIQIYRTDSRDNKGSGKRDGNGRERWTAPRGYKGKREPKEH